MRTANQRLRAAIVTAAAAALGTGGLSALLVPAHASGTFTLQRIAGADSYATAGAIDQAAYPTGEPGGSVFLADGLAAHATDALAASGLEGIDGVGILLTDNTDTVPANTLSALSANKVHNIDVIGGTASVSAAQVSQLQSDGYTVTTPFQGTTRYQTMQLIDQSIQPSQVGTDAGGLPTAILASGDPSHYVDALSAGSLAYAKHFPIILTNSTSSTLESEAQQVITSLGIKDLIVVGGPSSIPTSQYSPKPSGVTQVEVEYGADRSATSMALADYGISQSWLKNTSLDLARGDEGTDALAGAALGGINGFPTIITDSPSAIGSAASFASEHEATLTGTSHVFGGTAAVPASQVSAVAAAGGAASPASAGTIAPTTGQQVNSVSSASFSQGGLSYAYGSGDTYQLDTTTVPGAPASCTSTTYATFQSDLTNGDLVTGTYAPGSTSTFCLNDQAPHPPSSVTAATNTTAGGATVTWSAPATQAGDGIVSYQVWRVLATVSTLPGVPESCPAAYTVAPGTSPQTPPSGYTALGTVPLSSGSSGTFTYSDSTATQNSSGNAEYCYAVSGVSMSAGGTNQVGTATPATPSSPLQPADPGPVAPGTATTGTAPSISSVSAAGHTITVTYNENINPATVDSNGSDYQFPCSEVTQTSGLPSSPPSSTTCGSGTSNYGPTHAYGLNDQVFVDVPWGTVNPGTFSVTPVKGSDGNSVCAAASTTACQAIPATAVSGTAVAGGTNPLLNGATISSSGGSIDVTYAEPIDCVTVDPSGDQYSATETGLPIAISAAACSGTAPTSTTVVLTAPAVPGGTISVSYSPGPSPTSGTTYTSAYGIVSSSTGGAEPVKDGPVA